MSLLILFHDGEYISFNFIPMIFLHLRMRLRLVKVQYIIPQMEGG